MDSLLVAALLVASTLFAVTDAALILTGGAVTVGGVGAAKLAAGGLVVGALALGAKKKLLLKKRGKRDADESCTSFDNPDTYFALAASGDSLDCGRRFVCEVQAAPEQNLTTEELLIRNLFGEGLASANGSAANYYAEAGSIGLAGGVEACVDAFSTCPYDRNTILQAYQKMEAAQ